MKNLQAWKINSSFFPSEKLFRGINEAFPRNNLIFLWSEEDKWKNEENFFITSSWLLRWSCLCKVTGLFAVKIFVLEVRAMFLNTRIMLGFVMDFLSLNYSQANRTNLLNTLCLMEEFWREIAKVNNWKILS